MKNSMFSAEGACMSETKKVLCIDVGGTRIKFAVLTDTSLQQLAAKPARVIDTLGWLNSSLPHIVNKEYEGSVASIAGEFDEVVICVPGKVDAGGCFHRLGLTVPENLKQQLIERCGRKVTVFNDGVAWMLGISHLLCDDIPTLLLGFGTGVTACIFDTEKGVEGVELYAKAWPKLIEAHGNEGWTNTGWIAHAICGVNFFKWVKHHHAEWDYSKIRQEFTRRVKALIADMAPKERRIVLVGGNSSYIQVTALSADFQYITYTHPKLETVSPDLMPLLGMLRSRR